MNASNNSFRPIRVDSDGKKKSEEQAVVSGVRTPSNKSFVPLKERNRFSWKRVIASFFTYTALITAGVCVGLYFYYSHNFWGAMKHSDVKTVDAADIDTIKLADIEIDGEHAAALASIMEEGEIADVALNLDLGEQNADTTSSWFNGGHTGIRIDEDHPIKKIEQVDDHVQNILVFGIDSRGTGDVHDSRADAMMIVTVNTDKEVITLTSLMRDMKVKMGSHEDKLNHAYQRGGVGLLINTINENFKLDIQNFVMLDFASATRLIDLIEGVKIEVLPKEIKSLNINITEENNLLGRSEPLIYDSGLQSLNGLQATAWARIRKADSDFIRADRQRILAEKLIKKISVQATLTQIALLRESAGMFETNMSQNDMLSLGMSALPFAKNIDHKRIPDDTLYTTTPPDAPTYYIYVKWEQQIPLLHEYIWGNADSQ